MKFLKPEQIKTDPESLAYWGKDWTSYFDIKAQAIVFPESLEDVQELVRWARLNKVKLVPSGGRTGLSGAAVATQNEVVVSFDRMNKILDFNAVDQIVKVQAGVVTEQLQKFAESKNLLYPVDFAARGSSQIGGNIATNAGGIKVVRYGMTRDWIAGLTVVTGTGQVLHLNKGLIKNATGYDLRQLFIGSEGTLGFIVEADLKLAPPAPANKVMVLATTGLEAIMQVFAEFKIKTQLTAFEMFTHKAMQHVIEAGHTAKPFETVADYYVVAEVETPDEHAEELALSVFESCLEKGLISDGVMSQSEVQAIEFWKLRENISESLAKFSPYKNDISVRISEVPRFLTEIDQLLAKHYPAWEVVWFGHIGDGNLHINILRPPGMSKEDFVKECQKVDTLVYQVVQKYSGAISAEHGVGLTKKPFLGFSRSPEEIEIMRQIKSIFDPDNILNPGKIF